MEKYLRAGRIEDARFLSSVVTGAIGRELCVGLAGSEERLPLVDELFTRLASEPDSQYSYKNAIVAVTPQGEYEGGIIAYDGAALHRLRRAFVRAANEILGWNVTEEEAEKWGDEADAGEIYIDSLFVVPEFRDRGVASALVKGVRERFETTPKPLGLLVEPDNLRARQAYAHWGFREVGISNFFQTPMIHLQKPLTLH